jgi:hypothetical protein
MKRILIGLVIGLALLEAGRRWHRPVDDAGAAGSAAYAAGDFAAAEARFREAEQTTPQPALAAYDRAAALYRLRRFDDADHSYERSADDAALHAARAHYDRGNCAFSKACQDEGTADPDLLEQAARNYEACLAREEATASAGTLFDDARHNLELTRLILDEFAEEDKDPSAADRSGPGATDQPQDDPFSPANAAHPPEAPEEQKTNTADKDGSKQDPDKDTTDGQAKADGNESPKDQKQQSAESKSGAEQKEQAHECKQCKRGGCPKCKKPGSKPGGPTEAPGKKGAAPKPNPGESDNGKAPGQAKSKDEANHSGKGEGKKPGNAPKGKPGPGGKPNPNGKNAVADAKAEGRGEADPSQRDHKSSSSHAKTVGPDGVTYERQDKPQPGGAGGGEGDASPEVKQAQSGGKSGKTPGMLGEAPAPIDPRDQPQKDELDKLFGPGAVPRPKEGKGSGSGGNDYGRARLGSGAAIKDAEETDGSGDPAERAAARKLRQAIQRIQNARDGRGSAPPAKSGEAPGSDRRRDW